MASKGLADLLLRVLQHGMYLGTRKVQNVDLTRIPGPKAVTGAARHRTLAALGFAVVAPALQISVDWIGVGHGAPAVARVQDASP